MLYRCTQFHLKHSKDPGRLQKELRFMPELFEKAGKGAFLNFEHVIETRGYKLLENIGAPFMTSFVIRDIRTSYFHPHLAHVRTTAVD